MLTTCRYPHQLLHIAWASDVRYVGDRYGRHCFRSVCKKGCQGWTEHCELFTSSNFGRHHEITFLSSLNSSGLGSCLFLVHCNLFLMIL